MKRREALTLMVGSAVALLPIASSSANQKRKTIYCMRNGQVRKVTGVNPACPVGWKKTTAKKGKAALQAQKNATKNQSNNSASSSNQSNTPAGSSNQSGNTDSNPTTSVPSNWVKLTTLAALPNATATRFANRNVWVIKNGTSVTGFSGRCTHQGVSVVAQGAGFYCPGHGATYDRNGQNPTGPAPRALDRVRLEVTNGDVYLVP